MDGLVVSFLYPSHRNPERLEQTEVCEWCGSRVGVSRLKVCTIFPLVGLRVCDAHEPMRSNPTHNDYVAAATPLEYGEAGIRQQPFGMEPWWLDPLNNGLE